MAQQHANVPKFGNWAGDVPYTQCFDNARRGRIAGRPINPNDPQENPEAFPQDIPSAQAPPSIQAAELEPRRPNHERRTSREDSEFHRSAGSANHRRARRFSTGSDRSVEQSPLDPNYQSRPVKDGVSPSSLERRASSESHGVAPRTPVRSRVRDSGRGDEAPDKDSKVPEFGKWESDPNSADGFTGIFDKVIAEKQDSAVRVPVVRNDSMPGHKRDGSSQNAGCSCFGWLKK